MNEMLDRVKAALKEEIGDIPWERIERAAIKALIAMKSPSAEMVSAGAYAAVQDDHMMPVANLGVAWTAMVDAAVQAPALGLPEGLKPNFKRGLA